MVFESVVKEILNRYLGAYVENLDANQLNVGIWSGNVELLDLTLKRDALKDLDLPIEVVHGYLGKLSLKIPWKNLYTEPVEAVVERLYVLAKPSKSVAYDAVKEELRQVAEKRAKLKLIEGANEAKAAVDKLKTDKSFMEKMIVQIVNNIQIKISDIHIRYEDGTTASNRFAFGLTLKRFDIHTTDADWQETYVKDQSAKTFKVAKLAGLAVYMNCNTESFDKYEGKLLLHQFKSTIGESEGNQPPDYNYIFGPISSDTRLKLNSTPDDDDPPFGVPKVELTIAMNRVTLGVTRHQYQNVIALAESLDRSMKGASFRKYRPHNLPVKGNAKQWWLFAYNAVLHPIRRRRKEWTWEHMEDVRHMCRKYEVALKAKRISRKPAPENLAICEEMETKLDLFNLIRIQNMVDIVVAKMEPEKPQKSGWFSSWFGGSSEKTDDCGNQAIMAQLGAAMTSDEKQKLFNAIGYQEQATPLELPKEFVAMSFFFELNLLEIVIRNEYLDLSKVGSINDSLEIDDPSRVILLQLRKVRMNLDQRPAAAAMDLNVRLGGIDIYGVKQGERVPALVKSQRRTEAEDQLSLNFETNPLDNSSDKIVKVRTRPLEIIFDGETILQLINVFKPPADVNLSKIQDAAAIKVAGVKERSATGLEFMVENRPRIKIDVELMPIYFILPQKGVYDVAAHNSLIVSLGTVKVFSTPRTLSTAEDVQSMYKEGHTSSDILQNVLDKCYDTVNLEIENVQILFVKPGDNWVSVLLQTEHTDMHVLEPTRLEFMAKACLISDDPRLPKTKCSGRLPYFGFRLSQDRFFDLVELLLSIPKPGDGEPVQPAPLMRKASSLYQSTSSLASRLLENEKARIKKRETGEQKNVVEPGGEVMQFTNLLVDFVIDEISITLLKSATPPTSPEDVFTTPVEDVAALADPVPVAAERVVEPPKKGNLLLVLKVQSIELYMRQRTYDSKVNLHLGGISLHQHFSPSPSQSTVIKIISTPKFEASSQEYLLKVAYLNTSRDSPEFSTKVSSVEQLIHVDFSLFVLCLHQEGLLDVLRLGDEIKNKLNAITASSGPKDREGSAGSPLTPGGKTPPGLAMITEEDEDGAEGQAAANLKKTRDGIVVDSIQLKIILRMERVSVMLDSVRRGVALIQIANLNTLVIKKSTYTEIGVNLKDIVVSDMNPLTHHPQILSVIGDAIDCTVVMYNLDETSAYNSDDMKIDLKMGGLRLFFVNWFIQSVLNFLDHFNAAQQAIASASAAAADAAKKNVVSAYEKATRLNLKVKIRAPIIIVPIDSQTLKALCLDLGLIKVSNHFTDHFVNDRNAVIDEMKLELSDFKLFHAEIVPAVTDGTETSDVSIKPAPNHILIPTSFTLNILRNLSASWYKERPDLEVFGKINAININLLASDYGYLMDILNRNLKEGANERNVSRAIVPGSVQVEESKSEETASQALVQRTSAIDKSAAADESSTPAKIGTFLKFAFTLDSLVINLFTDVDMGLATCGIYVLSVKGSILANDSINVSLILYDIQLDDTRKERQNQLTRYMGRKVTDDEAKEKSMIDITCSLHGPSTFADVRISGFDLIISMDFLMNLSAFAATPAAGAQRPLHAGPKAIAPAPRVEASEAAAAVAGGEKKQTNVTITIEQPDIILMEKMHGKATNALILNFEMNAKIRQEGSAQTIQGEMQNFNLHMCEFEMRHVHAVKYYIIRPVAISIHGSTPDNRGLKVAVMISDINISISPLILELVNRIIAQTTARFDLKDEKEAADYSDLWHPQPFNEEEHWFTQVETAQEAANVLKAAATETLNEICTVDMPALVLKIETGYGNHTIPMLRLGSKMHLNVRNWSSQIAVEGSLELGVSYYNSSLALWEPLLEPNEIMSQSGVTSKIPWVLNLGVNLEDNYDEIANESYKMTKMRIYSPETLELTITKSCLEVFQDLGVAFQEALKEEFKPPTITAPYSIQNDCGFDIVLSLKDGSFNLHESHLPSTHGVVAQKTFVFKSTHSQGGHVRPEDVTEVTIPAGESAYLELKESELAREAQANQAHIIDSTLLVQQEKFVYVQVGDIKKWLKIPVHKSDKRYFQLPRDNHDEGWGIVSDVKLETGSIALTLQGVVQITNHFATTIFMHRKKVDKYELIYEIAPNSTFNVPLHAIYNPHREWHFSLANYKPSMQGIHWRDSPTDFGYKKILHCDPEVSYEPFYIHVIRTRKELYFEHSAIYKMESVCYGFDLRPRVSIRNTLPIPIVISIASCGVTRDEEADEKLAKQIKDMSVTAANKSVSGRHEKSIDDFLDCGEKIVGPGEKMHLPTVQLVRPGSADHSRIVVRLIKYLEKDWSCKTSIPADPQENSIWAFESYDSTSEMSFSLGVHYEDKKGTLQLSLYCPFWMVNKTGLMLSYRLYGEGTLYHPPDHEGPILFSYPGKHFFGKKKTAVRVDSGEWSDKFSMDVAGSSGMVVCPSDNRKYAVAVHNALTEYSLTKKITFLPFYVMVNKAPFDIEVQESSRPSDPWISIPANSTHPLWPKTDLNQVLRARCCDDPTNVSTGFRYTDVQITLLELPNNSRGGIYVDVGVTEGGVYITFSEYSLGNAPALLINNTDREISYYERGNVNKRQVMPKQQRLFTWKDPAGERIMYWYKKDEKTTVETDLQKDEIGFNHIVGESDPGQKVFWVSFLDGLQRVLLFTYDEKSATDLQVSKNTKITQDVEIEIFGIGLSMVNNAKQLEILYLGISSTDVVWKEKKKSYFKNMKGSDSKIIETKYQEYLLDQVTGGASHKQYAVDLSGVVVDFQSMVIIKGPKKREIRRSFEPGFWFQQKQSQYQTHTHAKINRIQIDNQTSDPIFPVIFSPIQPPKSIAAQSEIKPFIELSIVERVIPYSTVKQYQYMKALIQEFHIKIDMDFITEVLLMVNAEESDEKREKRFVEQLELIRQPLHYNVHTSAQQKNFYDLLHLGPLKVHVSFSMQQTEKQNLPPIFSGIGVTLTDVNDVVFRLAYFERNYQFLTQKKLTSEAVAHYAGQALKQLYVLVFGLDVLGNPYGLVVGIKQGVEDLFYEPFQGLIQGPEEFAQGLVLGVRSLFGHTVGGAAGAASKITGAVGKGLATLTFDKDFQKKRRDQINKKPANLQEGLARSGKGLVMGVFDGVTGVITKPITGAKEDGVGGFFKGIGKGAVGLITKPTSGVIDFASGTFDSVRRATELLDEIVRLRPPRYLSSDNVVRPYSRRAAEGYKLLREVDKGKYATSDVFVHYEAFADPRKVLLVSDQRILYCMKQEMLGAWAVEWTYRWGEIRVFEVTDHAVVALVKDVKKKLFGMVDNKKVMFLDNETKRLRLNQMLNKKLEDYNQKNPI